MMMSPEKQVVFYSAILSILIAYAWWVHFRVWILRQDLFAIRDHLWDQMRLAGRLDDPSYRRTRDGINSMIRFAPYLSLRSIALVLTSNSKVASPEGPLPHEVEVARRKMVMRVFRYLFLETATGLCVLVITLLCLPFGIAYKQVAKWIERFADSTDIEKMKIPRGMSDPLCMG